MTFLHAAITGNNADLIKHVLQIYPLDGLDVVDFTYGKGTFWKKVDINKFRGFASLDVNPKVDGILKCDFRKTPFGEQFDAVFFDPPYRPYATKRSAIEQAYANLETTKNYSIKDLAELYNGGIVEAYRVLKPGGLLFVKMQDCVSSGKQHRQTITVYNQAIDAGFEDQDKFILINKSPLHFPGWKKQMHARKNYSELWVFKK